MSGPLPWPEIAGHTLDALSDARSGLSTALSWMRSDWPDGTGPVDADAMAEAQRLVAEAKAKVDAAKNALYRSTGR